MPSPFFSCRCWGRFLKRPVFAPSFRAHRGGRGICFFFVLAFTFIATSLPAQTPPKRPKILGIDSLHFYSTKLGAACEFYAKVADPALACDMYTGRAFDPLTVSPSIGQSVLFTKPVGNPLSNLLAEITFTADSLKGMRKYLQANGVQILQPKSANDQPLVISDPEGHHIRFVQYRIIASSSINLNPHRIIHVGFIVHDRPAMEHFYKDILGFRPYWHGGRTDDRDDWVSLQVPDGSDWVEFMLNVPDNADKRTLGVANHIALGVTDIQTAKAQLIKNGVTLTEEPKIGRGGKWQLNVYDPDGTRIEFMEFTPVQKPCCSEYTAPHPKP
jgi:catechol 2,3-dioxygenase-like lactoylglutathione lyase family enzyme